MQEQISLLPSLSLLETQIPPAPAEQGKGQAGLVCPQLQSNPGSGTEAFRDESPSSSGALQGPRALGVNCTPAGALGPAAPGSCLLQGLELPSGESSRRVGRGTVLSGGICLP